MSALYPRLAREFARPLISDVQGLSVDDLTARVQPLLPHHTYAPIGGREATAGDVLKLRDEIVEVAVVCGFPKRPALEQRVLFDGRAGRILHDRMDITPHQAADEEIWTHLTVGPLVDIGGWRFEALTEDHLLGRGPRSTFRRLWWRAELLGDYSWDEEHPLREDETVQIMERPELSASPSLARALVRSFVRRTDADPSVHRSNLMRDALKRAIRLSPFIRWEALTPNDLDDLLDTLFSAAASALLGPAQPHALGDRRAVVSEDATAKYLVPAIEMPAGETGYEPDPADTLPGEALDAKPSSEGGSASTSAFEDMHLAVVGQLIRKAVVARGSVADDELVECFEAVNGVVVDPRHHRLFAKLAWSAKGRGLLVRDDKVLRWSVGKKDEPVEQFGGWTYRDLVGRAKEVLAFDPEPFDRLLGEVCGEGRKPRIVASVLGTAINEAGREQRR